MVRKQMVSNNKNNDNNIAIRYFHLFSNVFVPMGLSLLKKQLLLLFFKAGINLVGTKTLEKRGDENNELQYYHHYFYSARCCNSLFSSLF